jgi:DNA-binding MarR family transcriptional regulator
MENSVQTTDHSTDRVAALAEFSEAYLEVARAQRRLRGRDAMKRGELSAPQTNLLLPLLDVGPMSSGQLADAAGLTPATTTHMLDQLAAAGIVERERSDADRRVVVSRLTEDGTRQLERRRAEMTEAWETALADLDAGALCDASAALRRVTAFVNEL